MEKETWKLIFNDDPSGNHFATLENSDIAQLECDVVKEVVNNQTVVTHYVILLHTRLNICNKNAKTAMKYYENKEEFERDFATLSAKFNIDESLGSNWILR